MVFKNAIDKNTPNIMFSDDLSTIYSLIGGFYFFIYVSCSLLSLHIFSTLSLYVLLFYISLLGYFVAVVLHGIFF